MIAIIKIGILLILLVDSNSYLHQKLRVNKLTLFSKGQISKTGRHTYATWNNDDSDNNNNSNDSNNDEGEDDDDGKNIEETKNYKQRENGNSLLKTIFNNLVFYGIGETVSTKQLSSKPKNYRKSPFFTVSESIGQKILEDRSIRSIPRTEKKFIHKETDNKIISDEKPSTEELTSILEKLSEDLQILEVSIVDTEIQLSAMKTKNDTQDDDDEDVKSLQYHLTKMLKKRERILEKIDQIQIQIVNSELERNK